MESVAGDSASAKPTVLKRIENVIELQIVWWCMIDSKTVSKDTRLYASDEQPPCQGGDRVATKFRSLSAEIEGT